MPIHPNARQCSYRKPDGHRCGSPAWEDLDFCWHHFGLADHLKRKSFSIPALDDQNSVQVAVMEVLNALVTQSVSRADAYTVLYGLQIARNNLKGLTLSPPAPDLIPAMLEKARQDGFAAGYDKGKHEDARARAKKDEEDGESLASFLLRELKPPAPRDAHGRPLDPATGEREPEWWNQKKDSSTG